MVKRQKVLLYIVISMALCLNGCKRFVSYFPKRAEIDSLEFIRVLGIDRSPEDPQNIRVTMQYTAQDNQQASQAGGGSKDNQSGEASKVRTIVSEGKTVSEAVKEAQLFNEREIFLGHVFAVIIGDEAAREDLGKYTDFISRGMELRLDNNIYIAKDTTAEELISKYSQSGKSLSETIEHFVANYGTTSTSGSLKLIELMEKLDDKNEGLFIPALNVIEKKADSAQNGEKSKEDINIELDGYGIIKDAMLIAYADKQLSAAINILNNKYISGDITVTDPYGYDVALEVIEVATNKKYNFDGEDIKSIDLHIIVNSNVGEQHSKENIYDNASMEYLFMEQADIVKEDVHSIIAFAQDHNVDILGFGKGMFKQHPVRWEKIKDDWDNIFPNLSVDIEVKSRILRTYDIIQPNRVRSME